MYTQSAGRKLVAARSGGGCEVGILGVCQGVVTNVHHRRKRSHGGSWSPANLLGLCGSGTTGCHGYIEAHPNYSRQYGYWIFSGDGEPNAVPVLLHVHTVPRWFLLDDEGTMT